MSVTSWARSGRVVEVPDLVFVPLSGAELRTWAESGTLAGPRPGYSATPALRQAFGLTDEEDAEYAALCIASIAGLLAHGRRLVAVAPATSSATSDEFGQVEVAGVDYRSVTSLFGEDTDPEPAAATAAAIRGAPLSQAWEAREVQALLADTDLLWYGPGEWQLLVG